MREILFRGKRIDGGQWDCNFIAYHDFRFSNGIRNEDWPLRTKRIGNIYDNPELLEGVQE